MCPLQSMSFIAHMIGLIRPASSADVIPANAAAPPSVIALSLSMATVARVNAVRILLLPVRRPPQQMVVIAPAMNFGRPAVGTDVEVAGSARPAAGSGFGGSVAVAAGEDARRTRLDLVAPHQRMTAIAFLMGWSTAVCADIVPALLALPSSVAALVIALAAGAGKNPVGVSFLASSPTQRVLLLASQVELRSPFATCTNAVLALLACPSSFAVRTVAFAALAQKSLLLILHYPVQQMSLQAKSIGNGRVATGRTHIVGTLGASPATSFAQIRGIAAAADESVVAAVDVVQSPKQRVVVLASFHCL